MNVSDSRFGVAPWLPPIHGGDTAMVAEVDPNISLAVQRLAPDRNRIPGDLLAERRSLAEREAVGKPTSHIERLPGVAFKVLNLIAKQVAEVINVEKVPYLLTSSAEIGRASCRGSV